MLTIILTLLAFIYTGFVVAKITKKTFSTKSIKILKIIHFTGLLVWE